MWARSLAAILLAPPLAVALVGLAALAAPDPQRDTLPVLLLFFPLWVTLMALAYLFRDGLRAWLWMGGATLAGFGLLYALKAAGVVGVAS